MLTPKPSILQISPYQPGKSSVEGKKAIKLSSNECALGPSPQAVEAHKAAASTLHRYPDGTAALVREAIAQVHSLPPERIVCGAGSDELIALLCHAYTQSGDEVLYSAHGFLMYKIYALGSGATPITAPEKNFTADPESLLEAVTERTKILFIANPNNPTGTYLSGEQLRYIRKNLRDDILLVIDAAYAEYADADDYEAGEKLVKAHENVVMLRTFSKIYGLPALRLGWGYMPEHVADIINRSRGPFNVSTPAIAAGTAAIRDREWCEKERAHVIQWRGDMANELKTIGLAPLPAQGNFLCIGFTEAELKTAQAAYEHLLKEGIITRKIAAYGLPNHLRITIGTADENKLVLQTLKNFMAA